MASRDCFSKVLPNIQLATRYDADGNEIQVILQFVFLLVNNRQYIHCDYHKILISTVHSMHRSMHYC